MTENQKKALGAIVRGLLMIAAGRLVTYKLVDGPVLGVALDELSAQIVGIIVAGVTLAWSILEKRLATWKVRVALATPPSASEEDLQKVLKSTAPGTIPTPFEVTSILKSK